jgi:hypothetical protein
MYVKELPRAVVEILQNGEKWSRITKIDKFVEQLETVQHKLSVDVDNVIAEIQECERCSSRKRNQNYTANLAVQTRGRR